MMTNSEKYRSMSDEKWAEILSHRVFTGCYNCPIEKFCDDETSGTCYGTWLSYLQQEVHDE